MTRKTIRENLNGLLDALKAAGVALNESQEMAISKSMDKILDSIAESEREAVTATKVIVERKMDAEYKKVVESLIHNLLEHAELTSEIQKGAIMREAKAQATKLIAEKVDSYLTKYVDKMVSEKTAVDYNKLKKYETLFESMKDVLVVNEDAVKEAISKAEAKYRKEENKISSENVDLIKENAALQKKVESLTREANGLRSAIDESKAAVLLEKKLKDVPDNEASKLRVLFEGASVDCVQKTFKKQLAKIMEAEGDEPSKPASEEQPEEEEGSLEEQISKVIATENEDCEDGACDKAEDTPPPIPPPDEEPVEEDDEVIDIPESVKAILNPPVEEEVKDPDPDNLDGIEEEDDGIPLDESERIDGRYMKFLIARASSITPRGANS